jgi:hypothetical protein
MSTLNELPSYLFWVPDVALTANIYIYIIVSVYFIVFH